MTNKEVQAFCKSLGMRQFGHVYRDLSFKCAGIDVHIFKRHVYVWVQCEDGLIRSWLPNWTKTRQA